MLILFLCTQFAEERIIVPKSNLTQWRGVAEEEQVTKGRRDAFGMLDAFVKTLCVPAPLRESRLLHLPSPDDCLRHFPMGSGVL